MSMLKSSKDWFAVTAGLTFGILLALGTAWVPTGSVAYADGSGSGSDSEAEAITVDLIGVGPGGGAPNAVLSVVHQVWAAESRGPELSTIH